MTELPDDPITAALSGPHLAIFTDGASYKNPNGPGGWGAVLCRMDGPTELRRLLRAGHDTGAVSNIRMEMTAVGAALEAIKPGEPQPIIVRPDLELIVKGMALWLPGWIERGWRKSDRKPVENVDLWLRIIAATEGKTVHWLWVRGHAGDERNELADQLANQQMQKAIRLMFDQAA